MKQIQFQRLSIRDLSWWNAIFSGDILVQWRGDPFRLRIVPAGKHPWEGEMRWPVAVHGHLGLWSFWIAPRLVRRHVETTLGEDVLGDLMSLPGDLREVMFEVIGEEFLDAAGQKLGMEIRRVQVDPAFAAPEQGVRLEMVRGETGECEARGVLALDSSGLGVLAEGLGRVVRAPKGWVRHISVVVAVLAGAVRLPLGTIKGLESGDIVLCDRGGHDRWVLWIPSGQEFLVERKEGGVFVVVAKGGAEMVEEKKESNDSEPMVAVDAVEVELRFEVGRKTMTVGELEGLGVGTVVPLETSLERYVKLYANRHCIGTGELVEIEGRLGVRIMEMWDGPSK